MTSSDPSELPPATSPSAAQARSYPWWSCLVRFVCRLLVSVAVLSVVVFFIVLSALPYGSGGTEYRALLLWTLLGCGVWTLAGLLPPLDSWGQTHTGRQIARYAAVIVAIVGTAGGWLAYSSQRDTAAQNARRATEALVMDTCRQDLKALGSPVQVDGMLVVSGEIHNPMVERLLGNNAVRFIELQPRDWPAPAYDAGKHGARVAFGNRSTFIDAWKDEKVIRLSLSTKGDPDCKLLAPETDARFERAPFGPDTCLRVEFDTQSRASHALKSIAHESSPQLIRWALVEQSSSRVLASLSASGARDASMRNEDGLDDQSIRIGGDVITCRAPHDSLMGIAVGPGRARDERLALSERRVRLQLDLTGPASLASWPSIEANEKMIAGWNDRGARYRRPDWEDAYRDAAQSGSARYQDGLIDFGEGTVIMPLLSRGHHRRTMVVGSSRGFMVAWPGRGPQWALARFDLEGRLLWKRRIMSRHSEYTELDGIEWEANEVRLYDVGRSNARNGDDTLAVTVALPPALSGAR